MSLLHHERASDTANADLKRTAELLPTRSMNTKNIISKLFASGCWHPWHVVQSIVRWHDGGTERG